MANPVVLMMAGGTGGHVFPALAVAKILSQDGFDIHWLGTAKGIENDLVVKAGIPLHHIDIAGLRGNGKLGLITAPWRIARAIWQARRIVKTLEPVAAVGFGGYATGPGGVAARLCAVPLLIHEQNAIAGMTNRLLRRISQVVMQAFPNALPQALTTGNPVRADVVALPEPGERFAQREAQAPLRVLVVGGSLGARALNHAVLNAMSLMAEQERPQLRHQVGKTHIDAMQQAYGEAGVSAEVTAFIDDMASAYAWADLLICRSGALTVSEVAAAGCAALFVPFPYAVDDHQTANARYLADENAALLCQQTQLTADYLVQVWRDAHGNKEHLQSMAERARRLAMTGAAEQVAAQVKRFYQNEH